MLVLFETASGYAIFKVLKEKNLKNVDDLFKDFETPESAKQVVKLKRFKKFKDMSSALDAVTSTHEGQISDPLRKMLKKLVSKGTQEELAVADTKLGGMIKSEFNIPCVHSDDIVQLMRCMRRQIDSLIGDKEHSAMTLGLAHSLSRYKVKFSPDKIDTMIVQAIATLDEMDKEINNYHMRAKEWYSWHFPELSKVVNENDAFIRTVMKLGNKQNAATCDLSNILPEEVEAEVKEAAEVSMGSEISPEDITMIQCLCKEIVGMAEDRTNLYEYLKNRMVTIAPNLTVLVGELVGARLISHAGSLLSLAKHPSSTVQILGAEKALFRALKSRHDTPKYGLIYHASLVGQTTPKNKGKLSRMLAAKAALAARVDALTEGTETDADLGIRQRTKLEMRLRQLDNKMSHRLSGRGKELLTPNRYQNVSEVRTYNTAADSTLPSVPKKRKLEEMEQGSGDVASPAEGSAKKKKKTKHQHDGEEAGATPMKVKTEPVANSDAASGSESASKKKKRKHQHDEEEAGATPVKVEPVADSDAASGGESASKKKKKKKKHQHDEEEAAATPVKVEAVADGDAVSGGESASKKKKKRKRQEDGEEGPSPVKVKTEPVADDETTSEQSDGSSGEKKKKKKKKSKSKDLD